MTQSRILLLTTLACLGATLSAGGARAACAPEDVPADGGVLCQGIDPDGFSAAADGIEITVKAGAQVLAPNGDAIRAEGRDVTLRNGGLVQAGGNIAGSGDVGEAGIRGGGGLTVENDGTVFGEKAGIVAGDGLDLRNGPDGLIASLDAGVSAGSEAGIRNGGVIVGQGDALRLDDLAGIANSGRILSVAGDGIDMQTGLIENTGEISTENVDGAGIRISAAPAVPVLGQPSFALPSGVQNGGTIRGGTGLLAGSGASTEFVLNTGLIEGTAGVALDLGAGDDVLVMGLSAQVIGDVLLGAGDDVLQFVNFSGMLSDAGLFDGGAGDDVAAFDLGLSRVSLIGKDGGLVSLSLDRGDAGGGAFSRFELTLANFEVFAFGRASYRLDEDGAFVRLRDGVAPVPLPAGGLLLLGGLGLLGGLARGRRHA